MGALITFRMEFFIVNEGLMISRLKFYEGWIFSSRLLDGAIPSRIYCKTYKNISLNVCKKYLVYFMREILSIACNNFCLSIIYMYNIQVIMCAIMGLIYEFLQLLQNQTKVQGNQPNLSKMTVTEFFIFMIFLIRVHVHVLTLCSKFGVKI